MIVLPAEQVTHADMDGTHHPHHPMSAWQSQQYPQQQQQQQQQDFHQSRYQQPHHHQEFNHPRYQQQEYISQAHSHPQTQMPLRPQPLTQIHPHSFQPGSSHGLIPQMERQSVPPLQSSQQVPHQVEDFPQLFQQIQKQLGNAGKQQETKSYLQSQYQPSSPSPNYAGSTTPSLPNLSQSPSTLHFSQSAPRIPSPTSLIPALLQPLNAPPQPPSCTVQAHSETYYRERNGVESLSSKQSSSSNPTHSHPLSRYMGTEAHESRGQSDPENTPRSGESRNILMPLNQAASEGAYIGSESAVSGKSACRQAETENSSTSGAQLSLPLCDEPSSLDELESTLGSVSSFPDGPMNSQSEREEDSNNSYSQDGSFPDSRQPGAFCIDSLLSTSTQKPPTQQKISSASSVDSVLGQENSTPSETTTTENNRKGESEIQTNESDSNNEKSVDEISWSSDSRLENTGTSLKKSLLKSDSKNIQNDEISSIPDTKGGVSDNSNQSASSEQPGNGGPDDVRAKEKKKNESSNQPDCGTKEKINEESPVPAKSQSTEKKEGKSALSALKRLRMSDLRKEQSKDRFELFNMGVEESDAPLGQQGDSATGSGQSLAVVSENLTCNQASDKESSRDSIKESTQSQSDRDEDSLMKDVSLDSSKEDSQSSEKDESQSSAKYSKKCHPLSIKPLKELMAPEAEKAAKKPRMKSGKSNKSDAIEKFAIVQVPGNIILTPTSTMHTPILAVTPSLPGPIILPSATAMTTTVALTDASNLAPSVLLPGHSAGSEHPTIETDTVINATGSNIPPTEDPLDTGDTEEKYNFVDVKYTPESENLRESSDLLYSDPFLMEDIKPSALVPEVVLKTEPEDSEDHSRDGTEGSWNHHSVNIPTTMDDCAPRGDISKRQGIRGNSGPGNVTEEASTVDDDVTHFFEPNERQFIDGKPLKVICHVCEVSVTSRLFKHHLFFGHLQCHFCNRKLVSCDMLNDIKSVKKNACSRSTTRQHCFRRWSLDPIEFLSYYIRKELVIKRFCAGKHGPPPVSDIIEEIEIYIGRLSDLADLSPWKMAIAKCYKYINERKPGTSTTNRKGTISFITSSNDTTCVLPKNIVSRSNAHLVTAVPSSSAATTLDVPSQICQKKAIAEVGKGGMEGEATIPEQVKSTGSVGTERSQWAESLKCQNTKVKEPPNMTCSCSRALTATILKTVFPRQPTCDNYLVIHYPTHPVPENCPTCSAQLDPTTVTVNASSHVITAQCLNCSLSIYIAQDPPGTPDPRESKRKVSSTQSSLTPPAKVAKLS